MWLILQPGIHSFLSIDLFKFSKPQDQYATAP